MSIKSVLPMCASCGQPTETQSMWRGSLSGRHTMIPAMQLTSLHYWGCHAVRVTINVWSSVFLTSTNVWSQAFCTIPMENTDCSLFIKAWVIANLSWKKNLFSKVVFWSVLRDSSQCFLKLPRDYYSFNRTSRLNLSCHSMTLWPETKSLSLSQRRLFACCMTLNTSWSQTVWYKI